MTSRIIPIVSIVLLLLLILGGVFIVRPQYDKYKELKAQLSAKETELKQEQDYYSKVNESADKLQDYKAELVKIESAFPEDASEPELLNFLLKTTLENGLVLRAISAVPGAGIAGAGKEELKGVVASLSVSGSYSAFKNFLFAVYRNSRMIDVVNIGFGSGGGAGQQLDLFDFSLGLTTYYLPKSAPVAK